MKATHSSTKLASYLLQLMSSLTMTISIHLSILWMNVEAPSSVCLLNPNGCTMEKRRKISSYYCIKLLRQCHIKEVCLATFGNKASLDSYPWIWSLCAKNDRSATLYIAQEFSNGVVTLFCAEQEDLNWHRIETALTHRG